MLNQWIEKKQKRNKHKKTTKKLNANLLANNKTKKNREGSWEKERGKETNTKAKTDR